MIHKAPKIEETKEESGIRKKNGLNYWVENFKSFKNQLFIETILDSGIKFDSGEERLVALLLQKYKLLASIKPGENYQVPSSQDSSTRFDFILKSKSSDNNFVFEYHPEYQEKRLIENIYRDMVKNKELALNLPKNVKPHTIAMRVYDAIQGKYLKKRLILLKK